MSRTDRIRAALAAPRARRAIRIAAALLLAPWLLLALAAALTELPPELAVGPEAFDASVVIRDRHGAVLRELRAADGARARWVPLAELGDRIQRALIAAEDRRFARHPGVDPLAMVRAAGQLAAERRVVSGASTLTQQLARTLRPRPRTLRGKLGEMALALRIEASLSKREILEQYLNRVVFGPGLRGVEAASRFYFDKPTAELSLAEAAALAAMPRGPTLYDPRRAPGRVLRRRDRILERMEDAGLCSAAEAAAARAEPLALAPRGAGLGAPHLVEAALSGAVDRAAGPLRERASEVTLTIDRGLQREIEALVADTARSLAARSVTAAAAVVLDNASAEILAYVGSPDPTDEERLGHNDGVIAPRQPGSTLKPFLYELAMERLGFTAATALPDVALELPLPSGGTYAPRNYDGRFHGPVRLREALANSYNVPAVWTAAALGPDRALERLRELGFATLDREGAHYGAAIALGDGEVRLVDLAAAYAALARGGLYLPPRAVRAAKDRVGAPIALAPAPPPARVMDPVRARIITDILADPRARVGAFGEDSVLELPFAVAVKTGTSKGFRDNLAVGTTPDVTVAVWVGNFDGAPMSGVSGVTGAGPLLHQALLAAARLRPPRPFAPVDPEAVVEVEICALSGMRPTDACPHRRPELVPREDAGALGGCDMHERVRVDRQTGLRAVPGTPEAEIEERVFERYDARLLPWARAAGRPIAPDDPAAGEPEARRAGAARVEIAFPPDGARFVLDPALASPQAIRLRAALPEGARRARFVLDGRVLPAPEGFVDWPLAVGPHRVRAEADGAAPGEEVEFSVE